MKYISPSVVSGSFGKSLLIPNKLYAIQLVLTPGTYIFDQAFMQYQFGIVRVALYSDFNDYPGAIVLDFGTPTQIAQDLNVYYDVSPLTLTDTKYWLVCISDREVSTTSYNGQKNPLLVSSIGVDITRNDSIVGYVYDYAYQSVFPTSFPTNSSTLIGTDSVPMILLRQTSFIPSSGGSGISGVSGFSGFGGSGASGISGFSGTGGTDLPTIMALVSLRI